MGSITRSACEKALVVAGLASPRDAVDYADVDCLDEVDCGSEWDANSEAPEEKLSQLEILRILSLNKLQHAELMSLWKTTSRPTRQECRDLAKKLKVTARRVTEWFELMRSSYGGNSDSGQGRLRPRKRRRPDGPFVYGIPEAPTTRSYCDSGQKIMWTADQIDAFCTVWAETHYPEPKKMDVLAEQLEIEVSTVKKWFKNARRQLMRCHMQEKTNLNGDSAELERVYSDSRRSKRSRKVPKSAVSLKIEAPERAFCLNTAQDMRDYVVHNLETLAVDVALDILAGRSPKIMVATPLKKRSVRIVGAKTRESLQFATLVRLFEIIHSLLLKSMTATPRDIYYLDPLLFKDPNNVQNAVNCLSATLMVPRYALNVISQSRGLVHGSLRVHHGESWLDYGGSHSGGSSIPAFCGKSLEVETDAAFVLLIEKVAVFQLLARAGISERFNCLLLTGAGYPDLATRSFLKNFVAQTGLPVRALVDADPHGIDIVCVYKYGAMKQELQVASLAVPSITWMGLRPSDIETLHIPSSALRPLKANERGKCRALLERERIKAEPEWRDCRRELESILSQNCKAELEALEEIRAAFIVDAYIPLKLAASDWI